MYIDQRQKDLIADTTDKDRKQIKDIHAMDYSEAYAITNSEDSTTGMRNTGGFYWLASALMNDGKYLRNVYGIFFGGSSYYGIIGLGYELCYGIRPVVSLTSGVYVKSGTGTEADPYILGKDE